MKSMLSIASPGSRISSPLAAWCNVARHRQAHASGPPAPRSATPLRGPVLKPPCCASATLQPRRYRARLAEKPGHRGSLHPPGPAAGPCRLLLERQGAGETETFFHREGRGAEEPEPPWTPQGRTLTAARNTACRPASCTPRAARSRDPAPGAVLGPPLALLFFAPLVAPGQRVRLLPRAWRSLDTASALRPLFDEDGMRARSHCSGAEETRYAALPSSRP